MLSYLEYRVGKTAGLAAVVRHSILARVFEGKLPRVFDADYMRGWTPEVLGFLRAARRTLAWRSDRTDWTLTAIILVHLHGKIGGAVSNQMRQSKAMSPDYSIKWWQSKESYPPAINPVRYFKERVQWRYAKGIPSLRNWAEIELGDARTRLQSWKRSDMKLLLTSPPYCDVTNYRSDNWIRLWILGEGALPDWEASQRYADRVGYRKMLAETFTAAKDAMADDATILVRTDTREFTRDVTAAVARASDASSVRSP